MDRAKEQAANELESITSQIEEGIRRGQYKWSEIQDAIMEKTKDAARQTDEYVHENAWTAIGMAAALGLVVGLLAGKR